MESHGSVVTYSDVVQLCLLKLLENVMVCTANYAKKFISVVAYALTWQYMCFVSCACSSMHTLIEN